MGTEITILTHDDPYYKEYQAWCDMVTCMINFVGMSTNLVDYITNSLETTYSKYNNFHQRGDHISIVDITNHAKIEDGIFFPTDFPDYIKNTSDPDTSLEKTTELMYSSNIQKLVTTNENTIGTREPNSENSNNHLMEACSLEYSDCVVSEDDFVLKNSEESKTYEESECKDNHTRRDETSNVDGNVQNQEISEIHKRPTGRYKNNIKSLSNSPQLREPLKEAILSLEMKEHNKKLAAATVSHTTKKIVDCKEESNQSDCTCNQDNSEIRKKHIRRKIGRFVRSKLNKKPLSAPNRESDTIITNVDRKKTISDTDEVPPQNDKFRVKPKSPIRINHKKKVSECKPQQTKINETNQQNKLEPPTMQGKSDLELSSTEDETKSTTQSLASTRLLFTNKNLNEKHLTAQQGKKVCATNEKTNKTSIRSSLYGSKIKPKPTNLKQKNANETTKDKEENCNSFNIPKTRAVVPHSKPIIKMKTTASQTIRNPKQMTKQKAILEEICLKSQQLNEEILRLQKLKGAIFTTDQKDSSVEMAFKYAAYKINKDRDLLPNTTLVYDIQYVPRDDSFKTSKKACLQMESGVQAIFGPSDPILGAHIQSICEALDVPHLEARIDFEPLPKKFSINLHPSQEDMNKAFKDLMTFLNWTKVAIIYEEDYGLFKLQELVKAPTARTEMYIRQASPTSYRQVLREVRQKEIYKLIVDTNPKNIQHFFRSILQLQMNDYRYHYMFTTFDLETFDLEDFKYNSVNITAFRIVDVDHEKVKETLDVMEKFKPIGTAILNRSGIIQAEPALMFDSVYVFAKGLAAMDSIKLMNLSCDIEKPWDDGLTLYNYVDYVTGLHGLTGNIEFTEGKRSNFKVDLLKLKKEEIRKVGEWTPSGGINITDPNAFYENHAPNITLVVMTREERPYVMVKDEKNLTGNARYEGFCIDLLKWIAGQVGFQYTIRLVPDHMYGVYDPDTKEWNGIVRELMEKRADLAVASMTINYARESVIDFTKPFMNLGIGILFKVPTSQPTRLFSFMNPLAVEIWLYVLAAYMLVSFTLFVMARFSPYEWNNPHPCHQESDIVENQFSVSNSFWFITGTFLRQGSGLNPKVSVRMPNRLFSFLTPLAVDIWFYMLGAYILVSITMWIVARFSPREWKERELCDDCLLKKYAELYNEDECCKLHSPDGSSGFGSEVCNRGELVDGNDVKEERKCQDLIELDLQSTSNVFNDGEIEFVNDPCIEHYERTLEDVLENGFTIGNSFWFAIGSLMQQGSDLNPKATSTRIVGGIWWFFTLIIISSYTANLAAFLTVERMITPIESAQDLAEQTEIAYGTLEGGSTMTFFRDSKIGIYQKMWRFMESKKPTVFVKTYEEGVQRVLEGDYAFLMESTMLDYAVQRDCNLTQIGGLLDSKGYGIATPKGSPWRDKISLAILELQEKGVIQILYDKWWKNTGDVCNRDDKSKESKANALGVENIGGVFVVLLCGLALAIIVAILEFCWNSKKNAQTDRQSLCSEMAEELRFAVRCHGSRQRPALRRSCTRCSPATTYVPAALDLPHLNGEGIILPMMDVKKSPITYDIDT